MAAGDGDRISSGLAHGEAAGLAYREALPDHGPSGEDSGADSAPPLLCIHGFPESSYMWNRLLVAAAESGRRAIAPDLPGFGDSAAVPPTTWERLVESVEAFVAELDLDPVVLVVHDWGGLIGLRWACEHPVRVDSMVISNTGFFPDGKWHGMAEGLRTKGTGEQMLEAMDRDGFGALLASLSDGFEEAAIDHYWSSLGTPEGRQAVLDMYRSGDFEKLAPYEGRLAAIGAPALLLWGEDDPFAPLAGAHRLAKEVPGSRVHVVAGARHFVHADAPEECAEVIVSFLAG